MVILFCLVWFHNVLGNYKVIPRTGQKTERLTILRAATHETELGNHDFCLSRSHYTQMVMTMVILMNHDDDGDDDDDPDEGGVCDSEGVSYFSISCTTPLHRRKKKIVVLNGKAKRQTNGQTYR